MVEDANDEAFALFRGVAGPGGALDLGEDLVAVRHLLARRARDERPVAPERAAGRRATLDVLARARVAAQPQALELLVERGQRRPPAAAHRLERRVHPLPVRVGAVQRRDARPAVRAVLADQLQAPDHVHRAPVSAAIQMSRAESRVVRPALIALGERQYKRARRCGRRGVGRVHRTEALVLGCLVQRRRIVHRLGLELKVGRLIDAGGTERRVGQERQERGLLLLLLLHRLGEEDGVLLLLLLQLLLELLRLHLAAVLRARRGRRQHGGRHVHQLLLAVGVAQHGQPGLREALRFERDGERDEERDGRGREKSAR